MLHIHSMALEGSRFIITTHSPILLGLPESTILNFSKVGIRPNTRIRRQITKLFLERRERILEELFRGTAE